MRKRQYGLYAVVTLESGRKRYDRMHPKLSFTKPTAVRVFQNALLAGAFGHGPLCELRAIPKHDIPPSERAG